MKKYSKTFYFFADRDSNPKQKQLNLETLNHQINYEFKKKFVLFTSLINDAVFCIIFLFSDFKYCT